MSEGAWLAVAAVAPAVGAVASAVLGYALARRRYSGNVDATPARELWREQTKFREQMQDEMLLLRKEIAALRAELQAKDKAVLELEAKLHVAEKREAELEYQVDGLRMKLAAAEAREQTLRTELAELRAKTEGAFEDRR